jgi:hypothetical protein
MRRFAAALDRSEPCVGDVSRASHPVNTLGPVESDTFAWRFRATLKTARSGDTGGLATGQSFDSQYRAYSQLLQSVSALERNCRVTVRILAGNAHTDHRRRVAIAMQLHVCAPIQRTRCAAGQRTQEYQ